MNQGYTSKFKIPKMDCSAEEELVRMKLGTIAPVQTLKFDLPKRCLTVTHTGSITPVEKALEELKMGCQLLATTATAAEFKKESEVRDTKILWVVLWINIGFFAIEGVIGWLFESMGLVADGLDMLSDAWVYGLSLWAVSGPLLRKKMVAKISGYSQLLLAGLGLFEIIRRFVTNTDLLPDAAMMIGVSVLALIANSICLWLLMKSENKEAHITASVICTSNDVIVNFGVILAGLAVIFSNAVWPDLLIGLIVFTLVLRGAHRILRVAR